MWWATAVAAGLSAEVQPAIPSVTTHPPLPLRSPPAASPPLFALPVPPERSPRLPRRTAAACTRWALRGGGATPVLAGHRTEEGWLLPSRLVHTPPPHLPAPCAGAATCVQCTCTQGGRGLAGEARPPDLGCHPRSRWGENKRRGALGRGRPHPRPVSVAVPVAILPKLHPIVPRLPLFLSSHASAPVVVPDTHTPLRP